MTALLAAAQQQKSDDQTCGHCGGIHDTLTPCDQVEAQQQKENK